MERSTIVLGVLLAASLFGAYVSWTHEPVEDRDVDSVVAWDLEAESVKKIVWDTETRETVVEQRADELGRYLWVESEKRVPVPTSQPSDDEPKVVTKRESYKAARKLGEELLDRFAPFIVRRVLGTENKPQYGFDSSKGTLTIVGDKSRVFDIGGTGFGQRHTYLRDRDSREIYAVRSRSFKSLENPKRLVEKQLTPYAPSEIAAIEVIVDQKRRRYKHQNAQDPTAAFWSSGDDGDASVFGAWFQNKFFPLQIREYEDPVDGLQPLFQVAVVPFDGPTVTVELFRGTGKFEYAKSTFTRGLVSIDGSAVTDAFGDFVQNVAEF